MTRLDVPIPKISPKQRRLRRIWIVIIGIGALAGMAAAGYDGYNGAPGHVRQARDLLSNAPISPVVATILLAALVLTMLASVLYYRAIDEHDRSAQEYASLVGLNFYISLFIGWGIAAKGGFAPQINHGAVFVAVMVTYLATKFWRRYR